MNQGYLYIAVATVMFTSYEVVLKFIAGQINPVQLTLCRFAVGFLFLLPIALNTLKKRGKHLSKRDMSHFVLLGLIGIAMAMPILQMAVSYTNSGVTAVMFSCNPVFVTFLAFFMLQEPIKRRNLVALALEVAGVVVMISPWNTRLNLTGVFLALLSTLLFSVYGVAGKRKVAEFGGAVVTCFSFLFGSLIMLLLILLSHIPVMAQLFQSVGLENFAYIPVFAGYTLQNLPYVMFASVGVAGIGFCTYFLAMEHQPASVVSLVYFFKPALSPILAWVAHGEEITQNMFIGVVLIVVGSLCSIIPGIIEAKRIKS